MKLLYLALNPIQNPKPYRLLNNRPGLSYLVAYLRQLQDFSPSDENITKAAFSGAVTEGYQNRFLVNRSPLKDRGGFFSFFHPEVFHLVKNADIIIIYGHHTLTFMMAMCWARLLGKKVVLTTDATYMEANAESAGLKLKLKPYILQLLYNVLAHGVFVPSTASKLFLRQLGIKPDRIVVTPYVVDEDMITTVSAGTDILLFRKKLGLQPDDFVFVFCAKFIPRKRPHDALHALAGMTNKEAKLIMIGTGPLEEMLKQLAAELGVEKRVVFQGLVAYQELPACYTASDALVFCSEHEPYGLPVNEAMLCGIPVIVSDRIGAAQDLVEEGRTGFVYPCAATDQLAKLMDRLTANKEEALEMGAAARQKMEGWSSQTNVDRQLEYFKKWEK